MELNQKVIKRVRQFLIAENETKPGDRACGEGHCVKLASGSLNSREQEEEDQVRMHEEQGWGGGGRIRHKITEPLDLCAMRAMERGSHRAGEATEVLNTEKMYLVKI